MIPVDGAAFPSVVRRIAVRLKEIMPFCASITTGQACESRIVPVDGSLGFLLYMSSLGLDRSRLFFGLISTLEFLGDRTTGFDRRTEEERFTSCTCDVISGTRLTGLAVFRFGLSV